MQLKTTKRKPKKTLVTSIGAVIAQLRDSQDLSQSELARVSGLHRSYIGDLERGQRNISIKNVERLANALHVTPSKLIQIAEKELARILAN